MRHNLNLFLGKELSVLAESTLIHCLKYGVKEAVDYASTAYWIVQETGDVTITNIKKAPAREEFVSGLQNDYLVTESDQVNIAADNRKGTLQSFLSDLFSDHITINNPGDFNRMLLTLYVPAYDTELVKSALEVAEIAESMQVGYDIDIISLTNDVVRVLKEDKEEFTNSVELHRGNTKNNISCLAEKRNSLRYLRHSVVVDNKNANGLSLNLNKDSLTRLIGEYILLITENYAIVYNHAEDLDLEYPLNTIGLSILNLDRYYYVHYLLRRTYLKMMDKEKVMQERVDINRVGTIANELLSSDLNELDNIWNTYVRPLKEQKKSDNETVVETNPKFDELFVKITKHLQSFIERDDLSLPEKQAILAMIIGEDDALLQGYSFNSNNLTLDDFDDSLSEFHIKENNDGVQYEIKKRKKTLQEKLINCTTEKEREKLLEAEAEAELEDEKKLMYLPLPEIKELRGKIRQSTNYIREKTKDIERLEAQITNVAQAERRLTNEGFQFEGSIYQLQRNIIEKSLDETYVPHPVNEKSIDLRNNFTAVRDQGTQGACSSFALTAIYEYILKKSGITRPDLSEAFLYYNTRKKNNQTTEDSGTSLFDNLESLQKEGICSEHIFPYDASSFDVEPPVEAYEDGKQRLLIKAKNVKLAIDDIRSAISDGYPVAISMKVFDSFTSGNAFLQRVPQEERDRRKIEDDNNHAMVICGYSDEDKVFIVRNSWGTKFGDKGYCYMPYYYVSQDEMLNCAYIITDVSQKELKLFGINEKIAVSFDQTNSLIKSSILHILVDYEKILLEQFQNEYAEKRRQYDMVMGLLGKQNLRDEIKEKSITFRTERIAEEDSILNDMHKERQSALRRLDERQSRNKLILWGIFAASIITTSCFLVISDDLAETISSMPVYVFGIVPSAVSFILVLFYYSYCRSERTRLEMDWDDQISNHAMRIKKMKDELSMISLKSHIYGLSIDKLLQMQNVLKNKYQSVRSYVGNMKVWYKEEKDLFFDMEPLVKDPFITLLDNDTLDIYFEQNSDKLTKDINLYKLFAESNLSDKAIVDYKNKLKNTVIDRLNHSLEGFTVLKYFLKPTSFPYLSSEFSDIKELLPQMERKSVVFMPHNTGFSENQVARTLFIHCDNQDEKNLWITDSKRHFNIAPVWADSKTPYSLTLLQSKRIKVEDLLL